MAIVLTNDQLHQAWTERRRASWPPTFEACMADAVLARLVALHAWMTERRQQAAQARAQKSRPKELPLHMRLRRIDGADLKKLAAGDRD